MSATAAQDRPHGLWLKPDDTIEWLLGPIDSDWLGKTLGDFEGNVPTDPQLRGTIAYIEAESLFKAPANPVASLALGMPLHGDVILEGADGEPLPARAVEFLAREVAGPPVPGPRAEQLELWPSGPDDGPTAA